MLKTRIEMFKTALAIILLPVLLLSFAACENGSDPSPVQVSPSPVEGTPTPVQSASPSPDETDGGLFEFTERNMPRMDGSTATIPLAEAIRSVLLGKPRDESGVEFSGTSSAYRNLSYHNCDLLVVYEAAEETKQEISGFDSIFELAPIGRDGLVFLVNRDNPVDNLTLQQVKDIYQGKITNWSEVGGDDTPIKAYQRNETAGSQALMVKLVMDGEEMKDAEKEYVVGSMGGLVEVISSYDNSGHAIGYNVFYYVTNMKLDDNIKLLTIDGVTPTTETISSGEYPLVNDFYAVIRSDAAEGSPERILFDWLQSSDGQSLVAHEGYAPIG